jgi:Cys-tRNA(Pro) deacylase
MNYEDKLKDHIKKNGIKALHLHLSRSCHSAREAAVGVDIENVVKTICLIDSGKMVAGILCGNDRIDLSKIEKLLHTEKVKLATPHEILKRTGYPCGGVPPFGFEGKFVIDKKVMEKDVIYCGGGSESSLIKISPENLRKANEGVIAEIGE